jgi:hypothetical protein
MAYQAFLDRGEIYWSEMLPVLVLLMMYVYPVADTMMEAFVQVDV